MTKAKETLLFLANFNSWRRGNDDSSEQPDPFEVGVEIDVAVNLLRRYDELERENAALREVIKSNIIDLGQLSEEAVTLREDKKRLDWLEKNKFQHRDFNTGDSLGYEWCVSSSYEDEICVRAAIDAARKEAQP